MAAARMQCPQASPKNSSTPMTSVTAAPINDFAAASGGCSSGAARDDQAAGSAVALLRPAGPPSGPAVERLWGFCGDLGPRGRFLRDGDSLSSCVVAGERADDVSSEWLPREDP